MKYPFISMAKAFLFVLLAVPVLMAGCEKGDKLNVGYYYIIIPGFKAPDYEKMLDSKNEEIRYNAICYLTENTSYAETLSSDSLKGTPEYLKALGCYQKIYPMMASGNAWVRSSAIRFINTFEYNRKEFLEDIMANNSRETNIQLEIVNDLAMNEGPEKTAPYQKFRFLKQQPSWLLQNSAYMLSDSLTKEHTADLLAEYRSTKEEYKKLLILGALSSQKNESVGEFLIGEWQATTNPLLKSELFSAWLEIISHEQSLAWFSTHQAELLKLMPGLIQGLDYDTIKSRSIDLTVIALKNGWDPSKAMMEVFKGTPTEPYLYYHQYNAKHREILPEEGPTKNAIRQVNIKKIQAAIDSRPDLKNSWEEYENANLTYPFPAEFLAKHEILAKEYLEKSSRLFNEYHIDTAKANKFLKRTREEANDLHNSKVKNRKPQ